MDQVLAEKVNAVLCRKAEKDMLGKLITQAQSCSYKQVSPRQNCCAFKMQVVRI